MLLTFDLSVYHISCTRRNTAGERNFVICDTGNFHRFYRSWVRLSRTIHQHIHAVHLVSSAETTICIQMLLRVCVLCKTALLLIIQFDMKM